MPDKLASAAPVEMDAAAKAPVRLAICVPHSSQVQAVFAFDFAKMLAWTTANCDNMTLMPFFCGGSLVMQQREKLVTWATSREADATHVLFLDSDMRFPKDLIPRLLAHDQAIVGANYTGRRPPYLPNAFRDMMRFNRVFCYDNSPDTEFVDALGMGVVMIRREVFEALRQRRPWFTVGWSADTEQFLGEDLYFCAQAREAGFRVMVDNVLSREVMHCGDAYYGVSHAVMAQEMREKGQFESEDMREDSPENLKESGDGAD